MRWHGVFKGLSQNVVEVIQYNVPASSGMVLSTKVMVEITTMEMEVKAQI